MSANGNAGAAAYGPVWLDANRYYDAERRFYEMSLADLITQAQKRANPGTPEKKQPVPNGMSQSSLASEIAFARQKIQNFLKSGEDGLNFSNSSLLSRLQKVETERRSMLTQMSKLTSDLANVYSKLSSIELKLNMTVHQDQIISQDKTPFSTNDDLVLNASNECDVLSRLEKCESENVLMQKKIAKFESDMTKVISRHASIEKTMNMQANNQVPSSKNVKCAIQNGASIASEDDDELDLFGSDEEDAAAAKLKEERLQAYATKKAKKPALIAKSSVILDVKPWDDETDMKAMEKAVREVQCDGLVWGASKLVPLAYGINKLQIVAVVEDEKVSIDWLQETIGEVEDLVQSVDVAAFNKL